VKDGVRGLKLLGGAFENDMAVVEDIGALGNRERGGDVLLDDHDGLAGRRQALADGEQIAHDDRCQTLEGLVEQQDLGAADQCPRDRQHLLLAAGEIGAPARAALLQSVGIGITNLIFTFVGLWLIDRLGRRTLLTIGSFGYIASLGLCAWAFFTHHYAIVPACIFAFIAAHAIGQGTVIWVLISEIFPNQYRATGQSLGSATHWIFAALLTTAFPAVVSTFAPGYIFLFFCGMMVLQLIWVRTMVPETKGVPLEEIQRQLGVEV